MSQRIPFDDFSMVRLGDRRLDRRMSIIVAQASVESTGTITGTFKTEAGREATYRFLRNDAVDPDALALGAAAAGFRRARNMDYVFVPCDGSTLTLPSVPDESEMGPVGNTWSSDLGLQVMSGHHREP